MRTLKFIVDKQIIKQDPDCDFSGIVPGSKGYLKAEFAFSSEWDGALKVAGFWRGSTECPPQVIKDGVSCMIPAEALVGKRFGIQVLGKKDGMRLATNQIKVRQDGR